MDVTFYRCTHCGNIALKLYDKNAPLFCCGEKMEALSANSVDAATEKHVPCVNVEGNQVQVQVGEVAHPMTQDHLITFICLLTEKGAQFVKLSAADKPLAEFALAEGDMPLRAYAYCNLHGLWAAQIVVHA